MTEWTSISVTEEQKEELERRKEDANHEGAIGAFLLDSIDGDISNGGLTEEDIQHIINEIAATADDTGRVDSDELANSVVRKLDYAQLANAVGEEIEARMG